MMKRRAQGMAVVMALLVVALATSAVAYMLAQHELWIRQSENLLAHAQAEAAARGGIEWARYARFSTGAPQSSAQGADVTIDDAQSRFNVNNVMRDGQVSDADAAALRRLFTLLSIKPALAAAVLDAIDADTETRTPGGAEDREYLALDPPRRAPNRPFSDIESLARLPGVDARTVAALRQVLVALPEATPVNVNTAPAAVLAAVVPGLTLDAARALVESRDETAFEDLGDFYAALPLQAAPSGATMLAVDSRYAFVVSRARAGRAQVAYRALIERRNPLPARVLWRARMEP